MQAIYAQAPSIDLKDVSSSIQFLIDDNVLSLVCFQSGNLVNGDASSLTADNNKVGKKMMNSLEFVRFLCFFSVWNIY